MSSQARPRSPRRPIIGPILGWELTTLSRRARYFAVRAVYALVLLTMIWICYVSAFSFFHSTGLRSLQQSSLFASQFYASFLVTQLIIVLGLAPAYVATSLPREKECKTIEYLFVSDLTNREIVLGKLLARMTNLFLLMLVGVPVVAFAGLFGGVDYQGLLLGTLETAAVLASVSTVAFVISLYSPTVRRALLNSYGVIFFVTTAVPLLFLIGISTVYAIATLMDPAWEQWFDRLSNEPWIQTIAGVIGLCHPMSPMWLHFVRASGYNNLGVSTLTASVTLVSLHLSIAALMVVWAILRLRASYRALGADVPRKKRRSLLKAIQAMIPRRRKSVYEQWPLLWKEIYSSRFRQLGILVRVLLAIGVGILYWMLIQVILSSNDYSWRRIDDELRSVTIPSLLIFFGLAYAVVAFRASSSIGEERDRDCWTSLLATPLTAREVIFSKLFGAIQAIQPFIIILLPLLLLDLWFGAITVLSAAYIFLSVLVNSFILAALGINQSLRRKSTGRAISMTLFLAVLFGGGIQLFATPILALSRADDATMVLLAGSVPWTPLVLGPIMSNVGITDEVFESVGCTIVFMILYVIAGLFLVGQCVFGFAKATGRIEEIDRYDPSSMPNRFPAPPQPAPALDSPKVESEQKT